MTDGPRPTKKWFLEMAQDAVADRGLNYGSPEDNFGRIATLWNAYIRCRYPDVELTLDAHDVALMMNQMKVARLSNSPAHDDSWVDVAGYAACGGNLPCPKRPE